MDGPVVLFVRRNFNKMLTFCIPAVSSHLPTRAGLFRLYDCRKHSATVHAFGPYSLSHHASGSEGRCASRTQSSACSQLYASMVHS